MRPLIALLSGGLAQQLAYRTHFIGHLVVLLLYFSLQIVFFDRIYVYADDIAGWDKRGIYLIFFSYVIILLISECVVESVNDFFKKVYLGGIDPFLMCPMPILFIVLARWSRPMNFLIAVVVGGGVFVFRREYLFGDLSVGFFLIYLFVILIGVFCNLLFVFGLNIATFVFKRRVPVDYIHGELRQLSILPSSIFPAGMFAFLMVSVPMTLVASIAAEVVVARRVEGLLPLLATVFLSCVIVGFGFRMSVRKFDSWGG